MRESVEELQAVQAHLEVLRRLLAELAMLDRRRVNKLRFDPAAQPFVRAPLFARPAVNQNKAQGHAAVE
jgi:hypothetical protein